LNLNFDGVESSVKLTDGDYDFIITEATLSKAASNTSDNLKVKLEITNGEFQGKSFPQYINIQATTMWRVKQFFDAVMNTDVQDVDIEADDLVGMTVSGTVTNDGQYNSVVAWFPTS
jgi:hypothetical protein